MNVAEISGGGGSDAADKAAADKYTYTWELSDREKLVLEYLSAKEKEETK